MKNKRLWEKKIILRLPLLVGGCCIIFSAPIIFQLSDNIHSLYEMLFCYANFLNIFIFGDSGVVDKIELFVFNNQSQYTSDISLIGVSLIFMIIISVIIGAFLDWKRTKIN